MHNSVLLSKYDFTCKRITEDGTKITMYSKLRTQTCSLSKHNQLSLAPTTISSETATHS